MQVSPSRRLAALAVIVLASLLGAACAGDDDDEPTSNGDDDGSTLAVPSEIGGDIVTSCTTNFGDLDLEQPDEQLEADIVARLEECESYLLEHGPGAGWVFDEFLNQASTESTTGWAPGIRESTASVQILLTAGDCDSSLGVRLLDDNDEIWNAPESIGSCKLGLLVRYRDAVPRHIVAGIEEEFGPGAEESEIADNRVLVKEPYGVAIGEDHVFGAIAADPATAIEAMINAAS